MAEDLPCESQNDGQTPCSDQKRIVENSFLGCFVHGMDAKGRAIIPITFRHKLGEKFYVCYTPDFKAIALYPKNQWENRFEKLIAMCDKDMRMRRILDRFTKYTFDDCEYDGQGRVLLPQQLREQVLGDAREVEISGATDHIRIMKNEAAKAESEEFNNDFPDVLAFMAEVNRK